jgi:excisionase family DNA binding protein
MQVLVYDQTEFINLLSHTVSAAVQLELSKQPLTTAQELKQFLTRQETAKLLGISLVTLDSYIRAGFITAFRLGHKVRFKHNDVVTALTKINIGG